VLGIGVCRVDVEFAVEVDVVTVPVEVADGVADELGVLLVGEGLKGLYRRVELACSEAPLYFLLGLFGRFIGGISTGSVLCPRGSL